MEPSSDRKRHRHSPQQYIPVSIVVTSAYNTTLERYRNALKDAEDLLEQIKANRDSETRQMNNLADLKEEQLVLNQKRQELDMQVSKCKVKIEKQKKRVVQTRNFTEKASQKLRQLHQLLEKYAQDIQTAKQYVRMYGSPQAYGQQRNEN